MTLTTEQAHWIVGGELLLLAFLLLAYETHVWRPAGLRFALAVGLLFFAAEGMFGSMVQGDLAPERFRTETIQHITMGGACLAAGVVEGFRAAGRLRHDVWRAVLPLAILTLAVLFAFHSQEHAPGVSHTLLTMQHRILAAPCSTESWPRRSRWAGWPKERPNCLIRPPGAWARRGSSR